MNQSVGDALKLEEIKLSRFAQEAGTKKSAKIKALHSDLSRRGLFHSGMRYSSELELKWEAVHFVIEQAIALRRELGASVPAILEKTHLAELEKKLHRYIDSAVSAVDTNDTTLGNAAMKSISTASRDKARGLKGTVTQDIVELALEASLGIHDRGNSMTSINISNNTIATLNLGSISLAQMGGPHGRRTPLSPAPPIRYRFRPEGLQYNRPHQQAWITARNLVQRSSHER